MAPFGERSVLQLLKYGDPIVVLPPMTLWWRQHLYPDSDGVCVTMQINNLHAPTEVMYTWSDRYGPDDDLIESYAARVTECDDDWMRDSFSNPTRAAYDSTSHSVLTALLNRRIFYLDVLWHKPPTAGRWETLTAPSRHTHPNDHKYVRKLQGEFLLSTLPKFQ